MSRSTLAASKTELVGLLWSSGAPTFTVSGIAAGSIRVYDHEPRDLSHPFNVTVSTAGMTPEDWVIVVRIYVPTGADAKTAQDQLDLLMPAVDAKIGSNGGFGPSDWQVAWNADLEAFEASNVLNVGRDTF